MGLCDKFGYDMTKGCWDIGLHPVWRLRGRIWLAVAAKRFWIWKINYIFLSSMGWRSSVPRLEKIGQLFWKEIHFKGFWHKPRWRKIHHGTKLRHRVRVELGLTQGIKWYLACEYWTNGSKVITMKSMFNFDLLVALGYDHKLATTNLGHGIMVLSWINVPNFTTAFYGLP